MCFWLTGGKMVLWEKLSMSMKLKCTVVKAICSLGLIER